MQTSKKLTWLSKDAARVPATLLDYDFLITKKKLEEEDSLEGCLNEKTVFETPAEVDASLMELKQGDIIQLERKGFFICDSAANETRRFILIPDGRVRAPGQVTAGSKA